MTLEIVPWRQIEPLLKVNREQWAFAFQPAYLDWYETVQKTSPWMALDVDTQALMPLLLYHGRYLKLCQVMFPPLREGRRLTVWEEQCMLEALLREILTKRLAHRLVQPPVFALFQAAPKTSKWCEFGTYSLDLQQADEQALWAGLHVKHRNVISNARRRGIDLRFGRDQLDLFHSLHTETMRRSGLYTEPLFWFREMYDRLGEDGVVCGVSYDGDQPQGGLFVPFSLYGAFYLYGASARILPVTGAINYLHWETICHLRRRGVRKYDFVGARLTDVSGTKLAGIQRFKERFGATLEKGYLWKADVAARPCQLSDILLSLRLGVSRKERSLDIIDQENKKLHL